MTELERLSKELAKLPADILVTMLAYVDLMRADARKQALWDALDALHKVSLLYDADAALREMIAKERE